MWIMSFLPFFLHERLLSLFLLILHLYSNQGRQDKNKSCQECHSGKPKEVVGHPSFLCTRTQPQWVMFNGPFSMITVKTLMRHKQIRRHTQGGECSLWFQVWTQKGCFCRPSNISVWRHALTSGPDSQRNTTFQSEKIQGKFVSPP